LISHYKEICHGFQSKYKGSHAKQKKTALLEQCLWEIESILAAGIIPKPLSFEHPPSSAKASSSTFPRVLREVEERKALLEMEDRTALLVEMDKCKAVLMCKALLEMGYYQTILYIHTKAPTLHRNLIPS
jgi:hypothetical protein